MKIKAPSTKVKNKKSGLFYRLFPRPDVDKDAYYLTANDGLVPSGQMIYRTEDELDEMFEEAE
jgi:hypothetical protein